MEGPRCRVAPTTAGNASASPQLGSGNSILLTALIVSALVINANAKSGWAAQLRSGGSIISLALWDLLGGLSLGSGRIVQRHFEAPRHMACLGETRACSETMAPKKQAVNTPVARSAECEVIETTIRAESGRWKTPVIVRFASTPHRGKFMGTAQTAKCVAIDRNLPLGTLTCAAIPRSRHGERGC